MREEKICTQQLFDAVFAEGKRIHCNYGLFLIKKNNLQYARAGVIVGKKNIKLAVKRNAIKRCFREWFRLHKIHLSGRDLVFVAKKQLAFADMILVGDKIIQYVHPGQNSNLANSRI